jgi:hypothetical protein
MLVALKTWSLKLEFLSCRMDHTPGCFFPTFEIRVCGGSKLGNLDVKKSEWTRGHASIEYKQVTANEKLWSAKGELSKLHILRFENYVTLVYIDADCLVVNDLTSLLELGKVYQESEALIAAAPDIFPPDKFNAGVLVI